MNALTRWNPFNAPRLDPMVAFDDLLRGLGTRAGWREAASPPEIRLDVSESDGAYVVEAEIPGAGKDDIEVTVEGNQVSLGAELRREAKRKKNGDREVYAERYYGKVFRSFTLPAELDAAKAAARYEGGVLTLTLPKKSNGNARRIAIS